MPARCDCGPANRVCGVLRRDSQGFEPYERMLL